MFLARRTIMRSRSAILGVILVCLVVSVDAQIVNIEQERISSKDSTGWFGDAGIGFSASRTTKSHVAFEIKTGLQFKTRKSLFLLITDFAAVNADGEEFVNRGFGHLRFNTKLNKVIRWEAFIQGQYNKLTKVGQRYLVGTGPRFKLTPYENAKFYWGVSYMYEYEEVIDPLETNRDHRLSSYLSFTLAPQDNVSLTSTTYVQPRVDYFADYRLFNENVLEVSITGNLSLELHFTVGYDAFPPEGVPNVTYVTANGLTYEF